MHKNEINIKREFIKNNLIESPNTIQLSEVTKKYKITRHEVLEAALHGRISLNIQHKPENLKYIITDPAPILIGKNREILQTISDKEIVLKVKQYLKKQKIKYKHRYKGLGKLQKEDWSGCLDITAISLPTCCKPNLNSDKRISFEPTAEEYLYGLFPYCATFEIPKITDEDLLILEEEFKKAIIG